MVHHPLFKYNLFSFLYKVFGCYYAFKYFYEFAHLGTLQYLPGNAVSCLSV